MKAPRPTARSGPTAPPGSGSPAPPTAGAGAGAAADASSAAGLGRVAFATLGCKVNRADTQRVMEALPEGVRRVPFDEVADVVVINTCTVTGTADRDSRQLIARAHRRSPAAAILVTGCLADLRPEEVAHREGVVEVVANRDKATLAARILARLPGGGVLREAAGPTYQYRPWDATRPPLKIQDGCSGRCTYCTVAAARGAPRSLPPEEVLRALAIYGTQGCPEVVLAGIDLGSYGRDLSPPSSLGALLARVVAEDGLPQLRLSSLEVHQVDDALLLALAAARGRVCPHLHLPLQSGAEPVLARMGRPYDPAFFRGRVHGLREALPGVCLGADVIAGFPGEGEADHRTTLALLEELFPAYLHVFPYSPRPGTPAASFPDAVPLATRRARAAELRALSARLWLRFREAQVGRETTAVVLAQRRGGRLSAFTEHGIPVVLDGPDALVGRRIPLELIRVSEAGMEGRPLLE